MIVVKSTRINVTLIMPKLVGKKKKMNNLLKLFVLIAFYDKITENENFFFQFFVNKFAINKSYKK